MKIHVLIASAVYDHGVVGVYASEERARLMAESIWPQTDGHHYFRIEEAELDRTYENVFEYTFLEADADHLTQKEPDVKVFEKEPGPVPPYDEMRSP